MKTGEDVDISGLYASDCCGEELQLEKDETFPRCVKCMNLTRWELLESAEDQAA